jgi:hypothetical protein
MQTILVIVEGGCVQEVTARANQQWDTFDRDDFDDDPVEYWSGKDKATRAHIRSQWPALYEEIQSRVAKARTKERAENQRTAAADRIKARSVQHMNA